MRQSHRRSQQMLETNAKLTEKFAKNPILGESDIDAYTDIVWNKLARETYVIGGGMLDGMTETANSQTLISSVPELVGSYLVGTAFAAAQGKGGLVGLAAKVMGLALGVNSARMILDDERLVHLSDAAKATWRSGDNLDHNRGEIQKYGGRPAFETALMIVGGSAGATMRRTLIGPSLKHKSFDLVGNQNETTAHIGRSAQKVSSSSINPKDAQGVIRTDNCVACLSALMRNKFYNRSTRSYETAHDIERMFGSTASDLHFDGKMARNYLETAVGVSLTRTPVPIKSGAEPGHYAIFLGTGNKGLDHVVYGRVTANGNKFVYDPQIGQHYQWSEIARGKTAAAFKFLDSVPSTRPEATASSSQRELKRIQKSTAPTSKPSDVARPGSDGLSAKPFHHRRPVLVEGLVSNIRPSTKGRYGRHQEFTVLLADGDSLLVKHNLKIAPSIPLELGAKIRIKGEFLHQKGSERLIHWTHRSPEKSHIGGWINYSGNVYQ